ncbi:MAG: DUF167 domain-containing protein [archaeon]|nr:DUF167 domain-containing protein [archaeon]
MILKVKVKPNSREEKIEKIGENDYRISVKEPAEDNKANIRVINLLSKEIGTGHKNIKIKNPTSRDKIIEVKTDK